jgi:hypothetical protein
LLQIKSKSSPDLSQLIQEENEQPLNLANIGKQHVPKKHRKQNKVPYSRKISSLKIAELKNLKKKKVAKKENEYQLYDCKANIQYKI